jgi:hypothetical protein
MRGSFAYRWLLVCALDSIETWKPKPFLSKGHILTDKLLIAAPRLTRHIHTALD